MRQVDLPGKTCGFRVSSRFPESDGNQRFLHRPACGQMIQWQNVKTWARVPMPDGLPGEPGPAFRGFSMSAAGVTAWFSVASFTQPVAVPAQVAGMLTSDGGRTWRKVPLTCQGAPACAWQVTTGFLAGQNGLLRSGDGGAHGDWARYQGRPIAALGFWGLGENCDGQYLAVGARVGQQFVPVLYSPDAGRTWLPVQVPAPPSGWVRDPASPVWEFPAMRPQPDAALLVHRWDGPLEDQTWYRLRPGSKRWEPVPPPVD